MWKMSTTEKPKTMLATKGLIKEFVEMDPVPYDRPLSERRIQVYRRILAAGEFRPVTWASVLCYEVNQTMRVNGKHTATMLSTMNPVPEFYVTVERYVCDTLQDAANLYNTFDSKMATRTTNDINWAFAATIPELKDTPKRLVNHAVAAAAYKRWGDKAKDVPAAERAEELMDHYPFVLWLHEVLGAGTGGGNVTGKHLFKQPVVNAMLATYDRLPQKSKEFWESVKLESDPDRDAPTRVLARYLIRATLSGGSGSNARAAGKKLADPREVYVKCVHAWNAWRRGEGTALNYHANAPIPDVAR